MKQLSYRLSAILTACAVALCMSPLIAHAESGEILNPPGNLIRNPGFEEGEQDWQMNDFTPDVWFHTSIGKDPSLAHTGSYSGMVGCTNQDANYLSQNVTITRTGDYQLNAYVRATPMNDSKRMVLTMSVYSEETGDTVTYDITALGEMQEYERISLPLRLTRSDLSYRVAFTSYGEEALLFVDDVSLVMEQPAPEQILKNEGFEEGFSSWSAGGVASALVTDTQARTGTRSLYMGYTRFEPFGNYAQQVCPASPGEFSLSAWIRTAPGYSGVGAVLILDALDSTGRVISTNISEAAGSSPDGWKQISVSLTAPAGTAQIRAKIGGIYCIGAFYADDFQLLSIPDPVAELRAP